MAHRSYLQLPINADEGFPQAFRLSFLGNSYRISLYVNVLEGEAPLPDDHLFTLPQPGAYLVMAVAREDAAGATPLFRRRIVPNLEYEAGELAFLFGRMTVAKRNLNGIGAFGSEVIGGIAPR